MTNPLDGSKIALVTLDYPPERGGVARYLGNLVHVSNGKIDVFVNETHQASGPGHVHPTKLVRTAWPQWWPMVSFLRSLSRRYEFVSVSHAIPVGTAAFLARFFGGPKYVVLMHGLDLRLVLSSAWKRWLLRRVLRSARLVLANSNVIAKEIVAFDGKISPQVLTPGVEAMSFPMRNGTRSTLQIREEEFVILCVTRLVPRKGIDRLIAALPSLGDHARLVIVGDGEDRSRLADLAQAVKDRVTFVTSATDGERDAWYAAADVFALPVRDEGKDVEGFGIVYLEAALAGLPVVAGRSGGAVEAIEDGVTGVLVDPNDAEAISAALQTLANDAEMRRRMGEAGRARVLRDFRWEDRWTRLQELLWP